MTRLDTGVWLYIQREGHDGQHEAVERFRDALVRYENLQTDLSVERMSLRFDGEIVGRFVRDACLICGGEGSVENYRRDGRPDGWHDCAACGGSGQAPRLGRVA